MTSYKTIIERFEQKIEDPAAIQLSSADWHRMEVGWLHSALSYIELDCLKITHDLSKRDKEIEEFEENLDDNEIEIIALYMVVAWYDPLINSLEHTQMFYGSKDEKWTNQKDHLNAIRNTQKYYRTLARKYVRNHSSRVNSYLNGDE